MNSDNFPVSTNSYNLNHVSVNNKHAAIGHSSNDPANPVSLHGKVKVYTPEEIEALNCANGQTLGQFSFTE